MKKTILSGMLLAPLVILCGAKQYTIGSRSFAPTAAGCPTLCTDAFVGSSGASPSVNWTLGAGTWQLTGSGGARDITSAAPSDMWWSGNTFTANQYSQIAITGTISTGANEFAGPSVRHQSGSDSYYVFYMENGNALSGIWIVNSGSTGGQLCAASPNTFSSGVVPKLTAVGSTLTGYLNGSAVVSCSDSTYASGSPGVGSYHTEAGGDVITSFQAGNI